MTVLDYPFVYDILAGFSEVGDALTRDLGVWWFLAPILVLWVAMEVYLGEYKTEKWGFSSSLANSISFTWINITSLRLIFLQKSAITDDAQLWIAVIFLLYGLFLMYISFSHLFPEKIVGALGGPTSVYFLSVVSVLWGQGLLDISLPIIFDLVILYVAIWGIWAFIRMKFLGIRGEVEAVKKGEAPV